MRARAGSRSQTADCVAVSVDPDASSVAERTLRRAVALSPANPQARYALGNTLIRMGKTAEGMQHLTEFERLSSSARDDLRRQFEDPSPSTR